MCGIKDGEKSGEKNIGEDERYIYPSIGAHTMLPTERKPGTSHIL